MRRRLVLFGAVSLFSLIRKKKGKTPRRGAGSLAPRAPSAFAWVAGGRRKEKKPKQRLADEASGGNRAAGRMTPRLPVGRGPIARLISFFSLLISYEKRNLSGDRRLTPALALISSSSFGSCLGAHRQETRKMNREEIKGVTG